MAIYDAFARVYEAFMDEIPYEEWASKIADQLRKQGIMPGAALCELGCGTGRFTRLMQKKGYQMLGVDVSAEMLAQAEQKNTCREVFYICQDMRTLELAEPVQGIISVCDSMNYILEDLEEVFFRAMENLVPGGLFLFDMKTPNFYGEVLGIQDFTDVRDEAAYIWENDFNEETGINTYAMTLFIKEKGNLYARYEELHYQRAYYPAELKKMAEKAGFSQIRILGENLEEKPDPAAERMYMICIRPGKDEK